MRETREAVAKVGRDEDGERRERRERGEREEERGERREERGEGREMKGGRVEGCSMFYIATAYFAFKETTDLFSIFRSGKG